MAETVEDLRKRPEIRKELERATGQKHEESIEPDGADRFWFIVYAVVLGICAVLYFVTGAKLIPLPDNAVAITQRILRGIALITIVLTIARALSAYGLARIEGAATRFTLGRVVRLAVALAASATTPGSKRLFVI